MMKMLITGEVAAKGMTFTEEQENTLAQQTRSRKHKVTNEPRLGRPQAGHLCNDFYVSACCKRQHLIMTESQFKDIQTHLESCNNRPRNTL